MDKTLSGACAPESNAIACMRDHLTAAAIDRRPQVDDAWTDTEIVALHWRLLREVRELANPGVPLEDMLQTLAWVYCDPGQDRRPFSFAQCLRLVGGHPLSPIPYCGAVDTEAVRDWLRPQAQVWLARALSRYPDWVARNVRARPDWVLQQLERDPQWIGAQLRQRQREGDLFAEPPTENLELSN